MSKFGLGRGLGALIPQEPQEEENVETSGNGAGVIAEASQTDQVAEDDSVLQNQRLQEDVQANKQPEAVGYVLEVPVEDISPNPFQPRKTFEPMALQELADSIAANGILQPLVVTEKEDGKYELIAGERRLEAAKLVGLKTVPVIIHTYDLADKQKLELAVIENVQRADLNLIEQARAYHRLNEEFGLTHEQIAEKIGKSRPAITNILRLLQLPAEIQRGIMDGKITEGHGRALLQVADREKQFALYDLILKRKLPTDQAMALAKEWTARPHLRRDAKEKDEETRSLENLLKVKLGVKKVEIEKADNGGGKVHIYFLSDEELKALLDKFNSLN